MTDRKQQFEQLIEKLHSLKRAMAPETPGYGEECLAPSQWMVLHLVSHQEGIGIKELASQLGITSSAATQIVDGLVNKGFLTRQPSPEDRRALRLSLPEASRQKIEAIKAQRLEKIAAIFSVLTAEELQTFTDLIDKIATQNKPKE